MNLIKLLIFTLSAFTVSAQQFSNVDIVKVKATYEKEAMFFYTENWKAFRVEALKKGFISGFEVLRTKTDTTNHFQLILITHYTDSIAFQKREENFRPIMRSISPKGPKMLNTVQRKEFLEYISGYDAFHIDGATSKKE